MKRFRLYLILIFILAAHENWAASFFWRDRSPAVKSDLYQKLSPKNKVLWQRLLHYKGKGLVDSDLFYFHPQGKYNPGLELEETVKAMNDPDRVAGRFKQHPQCVFPARKKFLENQGIKFKKYDRCKDLNEWKKGISPQSVSLVFSSAYPNNPASMFGHTLIRFNKKHKKSDLLDYSVTFAADTMGVGNGTLYAIKGLFGLYKGFFSIHPYYVKVAEYNNSESRDLWEYELRLKDHQVERLINHLWELYSSAFFDYYFIDENCSYVLASYLEVANLDWELLKTNRWYYLPADLVKKIGKKNGIINSSFRPALEKQFLSRYNLLDDQEKKRVQKLIEGSDFSQDSVSTLDAYIKYLHYKLFNIRGVSNKFTDRLHEVLVKRSKMKGKLKQIENVGKNNPINSSKPSKLSLFAGSDRGDFIQGINYRSGYHDLLDNDKGYERFAELDFAKISLERNAKTRKTYLKKFSIIDITSIHPLRFYSLRPSWALEAAVERVSHVTSKRPYRPYFDFEVGPTLELSQSSLITLFMGGFVDYFSARDVKQDGGVSLSLLLTMSIIDKFKLIIFPKYVSYISNLKDNFGFRHKVGISYSISHNLELRFNYKLISKKHFIETDNYEARLGVGWHF